MLLLLAIYVLVISGGLLIVWSFYRRSRPSFSPQIKETIEEEAWHKEGLIKRPILIARPFSWFNRLILGRLGKVNQGIRDKMSFLDINLLPEDFLSIKYLIILGLFAAVYIIMKRMDFLWLAGIIVAGFFLPELYIKSLIKKRKKLILKALPDAIDLLTLCVEGGLDFVNGMQWVIKRTAMNPLVKEFSLVLHEIKMGKSRHDALKAMARRADIPDMFSFVNTLVLADRMGSPIADVLKTLAEEARRRRFQRGERQALQAPIKMLFPLILFILPVVAIIVGGPILIRFTQGGGPKF